MMRGSPWGLTMTTYLKPAPWWVVLVCSPSSYVSLSYSCFYIFLPSIKVLYRFVRCWRGRWDSISTSQCCHHSTEVYVLNFFTVRNMFRNLAYLHQLFRLFWRNSSLPFRCTQQFLLVQILCQLCRAHTILSYHRGKVLLFANTENSDPYTLDTRSRHESEPVLKGTKYVANAW